MGGGGGGADVCRFLAVSLLIVKMSGSCARGVRVIQDGLALFLSQPNLNELTTEIPNTNPLISPCPLFHIPKDPLPGTPSNPCSSLPGPTAQGVRHPASSNVLLFCLLTAVGNWSQAGVGARTGLGCPVMLSLFPLLLINPSLEQTFFPNTPPLPGFPSTVPTS